MKTIELIQNLPPTKKGLLPQIADYLSKLDLSIIVLDDDPTGTQTVYDVPVLTEWSQEVIQAELAQATKLFYILTNSRSLSEADANQLGREIGLNIQNAAKNVNRKVWVISRSDSTLRGHYPGEVDALEEGLGLAQTVRLIIPAFFEGGRYTIDDVHYVQEGNQLIPAAETPFAQDHSFGYKQSNLKHWIAEKTLNKVEADTVISFSIQELRKEELSAIVHKLDQCLPGDTAIVNAATYADLEVFTLALLHSKILPLCRTAASFVATLTGRPQKALLEKSEIIADDQQGGGLVVVGSYVPKSTKQLAHLKANSAIEAIELEVQMFLKAVDQQDQLLIQYAEQIDNMLRLGKDVVFYTSRTLLSFENKAANVAAASRISEFLSDIVKTLKIRPRFLIAKGGITSSDIATRGLNIKRAIVQGQILAGIPVWKLGEEAKFPGMSYIIFPGNVGSDAALTQAVDKLSL